MKQNKLFANTVSTYFLFTIFVWMDVTTKENQIQMSFSLMFSNKYFQIDLWIRKKTSKHNKIYMKFLVRAITICYKSCFNVLHIQGLLAMRWFRGVLIYCQRKIIIQELTWVWMQVALSGAPHRTTVGTSARTAPAGNRRHSSDR